MAFENSATSQDVAFDLILAGGWVIDGAGRPRRAADVGIRGDRIAAIGDLSGAGAVVRHDIRGRTVTPGFIDAHTHDDGALSSTPDLSFKTSQGVTTVVVGNCGVSLAPLLPEGELPRPLELVGAPSDFQFPWFRDYLAALDDAPPAVNAACLVGHTTLRAGAMARLDRPAETAEIHAMVERLEEAMEAGAIGLSSGLYYQTAQSAPTSEVLDLARVVARFGGLYATHMRDEGDRVIEAMNEALLIGRAAGIPVILSHHKVMGRANHGRSRETLALLNEASRSQPVGIDAYPYIAAATQLNMGMVEASAKVLITYSKAVPEVAGKELAAIARRWRVPLEEAVRRLQPAGAVYFMMAEKDVRRVLAWPGTMIGSDGLPRDDYPHPRLWGTFPRVLGRYARELGLFSMEEAVRRMTSLTAWRFGLRDRGVIREGAYADLVVLDEARVMDRATYEEPAAPADGIELVLVNGTAVWQGGRSTGARPGRALRRQELDAPMKGAE